VGDGSLSGYPSPAMTSHSILPHSPFRPTAFCNPPKLPFPPEPARAVTHSPDRIFRLPCLTRCQVTCSIPFAAAPLARVLIPFTLQPCRSPVCSFPRRIAYSFTFHAAPLSRSHTSFPLPDAPLNCLSRGGKAKGMSNPATGAVAKGKEQAVRRRVVQVQRNM